MYGGDQYIRSAAVAKKNTGSSKQQNPQSEAIQRCIERWGNDMNLCKKKYKPFEISSEEMENGRKYVRVQRLYGCAYHSNIRRSLIKKHGLRKGWYDFGSWSREKAYVRAKEYVGRERRGEVTGGEGMERFVCKGGMCALKRGGRDDVLEEIESDDEYEETNNASDSDSDSDSSSAKPPPPKKSHKRKEPSPSPQPLPKKSYKKKIPDATPKKSHKKVIITSYNEYLSLYGAGRHVSIVGPEWQAYKAKHADKVPDFAPKRSPGIITNYNEYVALYGAGRHASIVGPEWQAYKAKHADMVPDFAPKKSHKKVVITTYNGYVALKGAGRHASIVGPEWQAYKAKHPEKFPDAASNKSHKKKV
ncbi:hypothetical protein TrVE_jg7796 [Triparma verrucosa]|uniref:Uncharacterized protein n=1 Tax=Triparma verrucosa TaxID=1606542 RepID=A0A9W7B6W3_9STRA|nr:hypothetical protein TrVE_jg7796 [Triparma verrucosa]